MDPILVVGVGVASFAAAAVIHRRRGAALEAVAERRGLEIEGPLIRGDVDGQRVEATLRFRRRGHLGGLRPALVVATSFPVELDLGLVLEPAHGPVGQRVRPRVHLGPLDARWRVYADEEARALRLFGDEVRAALRAIPAGGDLHLDDRGLVLHSHDVDEAWLDRAVGHVARLATAIDRRRHAVDVAVSVAHLEPAWRRLAENLGLRFETCPMGMRGRAGPRGAPIFGHACRGRTRRLGARLGVELEAALWPDLVVHPTDERDALEESWGEDEQLLATSPPLRLLQGEARLPAELVAAIRDTAAALGPLRIEPRRLSVRRRQPPADPEEVLAIAHRLGELEAAFGVEQPLRSQSPYR